MKVLITGGTGLIGGAITQQLLKKDHQVVYLSRHPGKNAFEVPEFNWNVEAGKMDTAAFDGVNAIINLAGAPINKRWTPDYKSTVLRSRVDSTRLLFNEVQKHSIKLQAFINASAVGYYPNSLKKEFSEEEAPGDDFLSLVCQKWEAEAQNFEELGIRTLRMRIGIVLSTEGGALPAIAKPVKMGLGAPLASGKQWMPWVHLEDLARQFVFALENNQLSGAVNAAGPQNITNASLTKEVAQVLGKPLFMPNVPAFALKLALGEMAQTALASNKVSTQKIKQAGFSYNYNTLQEALQELYKN